MEEGTREINLSYASKKEWLYSILFGIVLGLFVIIPGVSGATLLIAFGLYYKVVYAVSNLTKKGHIKKSIIYLLPLVIGIFLGLLLGLFLIRFLLEKIPFSTIMLFAGLMIGSLPILLKEVKGKEKKGLNLILFILGLLTILTVCFISIYLAKDELFFNKKQEEQNLVNEPVVFYFLSILIGFVVGITQVIPGLSASAFLMMIGYYSKILNSIHFSLIIENPKIILIFLALVIGFILGIIVTNKFMFIAMRKFKEKMDFLIAGLSLGSVISIFVSKEIYEKVYLVYFNDKMTTLELVDTIFAFILLGVGVFLSLFITKFAKKKETTNLTN